MIETKKKQLTWSKHSKISLVSDKAALKILFGQCPKEAKNKVGQAVSNKKSCHFWIVSKIKVNTHDDESRNR